MNEESTCMVAEMTLARAIPGQLEYPQQIVHASSSCAITCSDFPERQNHTVSLKIKKSANTSPVHVIFEKLFQGIIQRHPQDMLNPMIQHNENPDGSMVTQNNGLTGKRCINKHPGEDLLKHLNSHALAK